MGGPDYFEMTAQLVILFLGTVAPILAPAIIQRIIPLRWMDPLEKLFRCFEMFGFGHWSAIIAVDFSWDIPVMLGTSGAVEPSVAYYKQLYGFGLIPVSATISLWFVYFSISWRVFKGGPGMWFNYFALA